MSRSGYSDDCEDNLAAGRWRAQVISTTRGKRGQTFLRELLKELDAMPVKRLVKYEFEADGEVCTLGCIARARGVNMGRFDPEDSEVGYEIGPALGIAQQLAREIMYENDEFIVWDPLKGRVRDDSVEAEKRWAYMRNWVASQIIVTPEEANAVEIEPTSAGE